MKITTHCIVEQTTITLFLLFFTSRVSSHVNRFGLSVGPSICNMTAKLFLPPALAVAVIESEPCVCEHSPAQTV